MVEIADPIGLSEMKPMALAVALVIGCTAPRPSASGEAEPTLADAPVEPSSTVDQPALNDLVVGPNPGCPPLRVFKDLEDLCARGIMPLDPMGLCEREQAEDQSKADVYGFPVVQAPAFGGVAELVSRRYADASGTESATTYLALRGTNGHVLLAEIATYDGEQSYPPTGVRFEGTARTLELQISQEFFEPPKIVSATVPCRMDGEGGIRCGDTCPTLAIEEVPQPLDCAAVEKYNWANLPRGEDVTADWGGNYDDERLEIALGWLAAQGNTSAATALRSMSEDDDYAHVALVRDVEVGDRTLTIIRLKSKDWVLLHEQVPLVASDGEIRVGQGPGGVFVVSHAAKQRRIHRLDLSTHELEPVTPGPCG